MSIKLVHITEDNYEKIINLTIKKSQTDFVASTTDSLAEERYDNYLHSLAVYAGNKAVGYGLYGWYEGKPIILRFLIDERYQGKKYGKESMKLFLSLFKDIYKEKTLFIPVDKNNHRAIKFYEGLGFVKTKEKHHSYPLYSIIF